MKVVICLILFLCSLIAPFPSPTAVADEGRFACVKQDCYFYLTKDLSNGIFILPETYFVKLLDEGDDYYHIEYLLDGEGTKKVTGFCPKERVSPVDFQPTNPYLIRFFELTYTLQAGVEKGFLTQITLTCTYYGDYYVGTTAYAYVLRGEEFGYVPKPEGFTYDKNLEYEQSLSPSTPSINPNASPPSYVYLIALALLAPAAAFLLLKFSKQPFDEKRPPT